MVWEGRGLLISYLFNVDRSGVDAIADDLSRRLMMIEEKDALGLAAGLRFFEVDKFSPPRPPLAPPS